MLPHTDTFIENVVLNKYVLSLSLNYYFFGQEYLNHKNNNGIYLLSVNTLLRLGKDGFKNLIGFPFPLKRICSYLLLA